LFLCGQPIFPRMDEPLSEKANGENLRVFWAEFSTLSQTVFVMSVITRHAQICSHLELKTRPSFCPLGLSLSKVEPVE
jgi:hypothetical protein